MLSTAALNSVEQPLTKLCPVLDVKNGPTEEKVAGFPYPKLSVRIDAYGILRVVWRFFFQRF